MEYVWVVTSNYWNGEYDSVGVVGVFDEATAKALVESKNKENEGRSSYATTYECEEFRFNVENGAV